ncbi:MAG: hypothetical protein QM723_11780 [Myxococcaceae bacterium]
MRIFALSLAAVLVLTGCPKPKPDMDGGTDSGMMNPPPKDACSGACGPLQKCDTATRQCVDACGGCSDGGTCVKTGQDTFECEVIPVVCSGTTCAPGQIACFAGECSCIKASVSQLDSCTSQGMICDGQQCQPPKALEQCKVGGAPCPQAYACQPVFGDPMDPNAIFLCTKTCGMLGGTCDLGELCFNIGCLPNGFANGFSCEQDIAPGDGGPAVAVTVPASNTCLLRDNNGNPTEAGAGTGNCTYAHLQLGNQGLYTQDTCRPPGHADAGQPCKDDYRSSQIATICNTGLECALTNGDGTGVCTQMCNAAPPRFGITPTPSCPMGQTCLNLYRQESPDQNSVLGGCFHSCNVFDPSSICQPFGSTPTSCVPTDPLGASLVTADGSGVCVPQNSTVASLDQPCGNTDPFQGAACNTNQVCATLDPTQPATCHALCDVDCSGSNAPSRCSTEANATCPGGKTCTRVTSTSGAILGFCQ